MARQGLAGAVNLEDPGQDIAAQGNHTEPVCQEIIAFARARWPEAKELVWLVNPVHLQTVPRLVCSDWPLSTYYEAAEARYTY